MCWVGSPSSGLKLQINKSSRKTQLVITVPFETRGGGKINACKMAMDGIDAISCIKQLHHAPKRASSMFVGQVSKAAPISP